MEESVRSGSVVKKKSSSGCLIIKKKGRDGKDTGGAGCSGGSHKEKKRPRLLTSDSMSSDELLEPVRRKISGHYRESAVVYSKTGAESKREYGGSGRLMEIDRKRTRLDLFDFDEYDEFEGMKVRDDDYMQHRLKMAGRSGNVREFISMSDRKPMVEKRKDSCMDGASSAPGGRIKGSEYGGKNRFELDDDEAHLPISSLRSKCQEAAAKPIRLQGKNGVLKVMVNKKKKMELSQKNANHLEVESRRISRDEALVKEEVLAQPLFYSNSKRSGRKTSFVDREKDETKLQKSFSGNSSKTGDYEGDGTDTALKLAPPSQHAGGSKKVMKKEEKKLSPIKHASPVREKDIKAKKAGSTEKQQLRERIRGMLIEAGWTIDYRPRKNRDYLDAVYINPSGTAYWSIIKAHDALQRQLQLEAGSSKVDSASFAPLPDGLINKLTRQTRKKMEEEMKKKRKGHVKNRDRNLKDSADDSDSDQNEERLSSYMRRQGGKLLKGKSEGRDHECREDLSDHSSQETFRKQMSGKTSCSSACKGIQGRKSRKIGRCTLLVRSANKGENAENDGYVPYTGKRTLLAWLIDSATVKLSQKVQYMNRRRSTVKLEGWVTRDGIHCGCCSKILPVSKFELHAGSKLRQPFQHIFLESGISLLQCQIEAWNRQDESERQDYYTIPIHGDDPDDDTCGICGDGGDLICCDSCPSTFHQSCLGIQMLPPGDWHCPSCVCKFCGIATEIAAEDNDDGDILLVKCLSCQRKYHRPCCEEKEIPSLNSFCSQKCQELHDNMQRILGVKHELEGGFSWSLIQRTDLGTDTMSRAFAQRVESNSKLAVALSVMDECFLPIVDRRSEINIIHNVLYNCGSNFNRLNYSGFYTAVLERGDEIICAASIRTHGTQLAEMPFIGTRHIYRRQGMCRRLLCAIEAVLSSFKVEKLIIPAISEHMNTWTSVFGFNELDDSLKQEMKSTNMLVFPGTDMLQKQLVKQQNLADGKAVEAKDNHPRLPVLVEKYDKDFSSGGCEDRDMHDYDGTPRGERASEVDAQASSSPTSVVLPRDVSNSDASFESSVNISSNQTKLDISEPAKMLVESSAGLKPPSSSGTDVVSLGIQNPVLDLPPTDDIQLSDDCKNGFSGAKLNAPFVASNLDCPDNTPANSQIEDPCNNKISFSVSTVPDDNGNVDAESSILLGPDSHSFKCTNFEFSCDPEDAPVIGPAPDGSVHDFCGQPAQGSYIDASSSAEGGVLKRKQNLASVSLISNGKECDKVLNSDLSQPIEANEVIDAKLPIQQGRTENSMIAELQNKTGNQAEDSSCKHDADFSEGTCIQESTGTTCKHEILLPGSTNQDGDKGIIVIASSLSSQVVTEMEGGVAVHGKKIPTVEDIELTCGANGKDCDIETAAYLSLNTLGKGPILDTEEKNHIVGSIYDFASETLPFNHDQNGLATPEVGQELGEASQVVYSETGNPIELTSLNKDDESSV